MTEEAAYLMLKERGGRDYSPTASSEVTSLMIQTLPTRTHLISFHYLLAAPWTGTKALFHGPLGDMYPNHDSENVSKC
jgi:hypothetical protein